MSGRAIYLQTLLLRNRLEEDGVITKADIWADYNKH